MRVNLTKYKTGKMALQNFDGRLNPREMSKELEFCCVCRYTLRIIGYNFAIIFHKKALNSKNARFSFHVHVQILRK